MAIPVLSRDRGRYAIMDINDDKGDWIANAILDLHAEILIIYRSLRGQWTNHEISLAGSEVIDKSEGLLNRKVREDRLKSVVTWHVENN